ETAEGARHDDISRTLYRPTLRFGVLAMVLAGIALVITGDTQAQIMFRQQPMKMASAEALCETQEGAPFSILTVGGPDAFSEDCSDVIHLIELPTLTSFLATHTFGAELQGVDDLNAQYKEEFGETVTDIHGNVQEADY